MNYSMPRSALPMPIRRRKTEKRHDPNWATLDGVPAIVGLATHLLWSKPPHVSFREKVWGVLKKSAAFRFELLSLLPCCRLDLVGLLGVSGGWHLIHPPVAHRDGPTHARKTFV